MNGQAPVADFSASTVAGCGPLGINFKDLSTGAPIFWTWDFGNGQISNLQNPISTYTVPGVYTVTLIVKNKSGESSIRKTDYITIYPYPTANFSANLTLACAPANIQFSDKSVPGQGSISAWSWDFGDGQTSNQSSPAHNYTQPGYYSVKLTVTNSQGCPNTFIRGRYIRVVSGVQPDFAWSQTSNSCSAPFNLNFTNQTSGPGNLSYSWDLGNGINTGLTNPSTSYPSNTNYTVILKATSDLGCSQTVQKTVSFPGANPIISSPDTACTNTPILFKNGSTPAPLSSAWDFGDGTSAVIPNPSKIYTAASTYTVKMVNKYAACADSITKLIHVLNKPAAGFTADKMFTCKAPFTVQFTDQSGSLPLSGWQWDFGDGTTSNLQSPSHTYTTVGNFDVTLTVTSSAGCSGTLTRSQFIRIAAPTVTLDQLPGQVCTNKPWNPVAVVTALDGIASYSWIANGATPSTSTSPTPTFTYATQGNYDVSLNITTTDGCSTGPVPFSNAVIVGDSVIPTFTISQPTPCANQPVTFTAFVDKPVNYWFWYFGDGDTSQHALTATHAYRDSGDFTVTMRVINHGCTTFAPSPPPQIVHINAPIANFGYKPICMDRHQINFSDSSKIDLTKGIPTYKWDFGDLTPPLFIGAPPGSPPLPHTYAYGTYNVTLIVNNGGCADTIVKQVMVNPQTIDFTSPDSVCKNANFSLTAIDTNYISAYSWTVDGTTTPGSSVFISSLPDTGIHALSLDVTDLNGCHYLSLPIYPHSLVVTGPAAKFTPANLMAGLAGGCRNTPVFFTDQSTPYSSGYPIVTWTWNFGGIAPIDFK
ncbi:MAG TPA: PKD domain-containing protein, partial [Puia sp.]|nr:PKD domain-containing protein [Puia sp.]